MDMKLVEAFALIMRMGSLTKAEAQSGVSKATLSRQLRRLEDQLGVQLLVRHPRKVVATDACRALHAHCDALLSHVSARLEAASTEVQEMSSGGTGRLCILSDNQFLTTFVSRVVRIFRKGAAIVDHEFADAYRRSLAQDATPMPVLPARQRKAKLVTQ